jgi:hypothetical protein
MTEENTREEAGTSHDPQVEIARLNEKIAHLEKKLQEQDCTEQQKTQEDLLQGVQMNLEHEGGCSEEVVEEESEADSDVQLANLIRRKRSGLRNWLSWSSNVTI